jgi:predicted metal-dependent enzyme (double-stranded beta helix superfamily)
MTNTYPTTIKNFINDLESNTEKMTSNLLKNLLQKNTVELSDIELWKDFDHPLLDGYGRKLVYAGKNFEIMVMSWLPGDYSAIHDHGETDWGLVQYFGEAEHNIYSLKDHKVKRIFNETTSFKQINLVDNSMIHQMGNPTNKPFLSLHIYGCHNELEPVTQNARIFDLLDNKIQYTNGGVFFLLPKELIVKEENVIQTSDRSTLRQHHFHLLVRVILLLKFTDPKEKLYYVGLYATLKELLFDEKECQDLESITKDMTLEDHDKFKDIFSEIQKMI